MTQLDRLARAVLTGDRAYLDRWAQDHTAKRSRQRVKKAPRRRVEAAKDATRAENWPRTRAAVLARAGGRCELCGALGFSLDAHHLAPGPLRRKYEAPNAVVACDRACHNGWHRGDVVALQASLEAAQRIGAPDIVQANLRRRLDKVTG